MDTALGILEGISQHGGEHHAEEGRCEHTALLHSVSDTEGIWCVTVIKDVSHHAIMELTDDCYELVWTSIFLHYLPQAIAADLIKSLGRMSTPF